MPRLFRPGTLPVTTTPVTTTPSLFDRRIAESMVKRLKTLSHGARRAGALLALLAVSFVTIEARGDTVTRLMLINADTDQDLFELLPGMEIDLAVTGPALNVRAETDPSPTGSVRFDYEGQIRIESGAPYAAFGNTGGDYASWTPALGSRTLEAVAFTGAGATGTPGAAYTVDFTVVNSGPSGLPGLQVLVVSETAGFNHGAQINAGEDMFEDLAAADGFDVTLTGNSSGFFTTSALAEYDVIVFLNTTGNFLNGSEEAAFESWMSDGGGFIGIHSATDTEYGWSFYGQLIGAYFANHPPGTTSATLNVETSSHPATAMLPASFTWTDEWYNFQSNPADDPDTTILVTIDESTYSGGTMGDPHPIAWCKEFGGGRMFYTAFGHNVSTYSSDWFQDHIRGAMEWVENSSPTPTESPFIRGDFDENGSVNIVDALRLLGSLFGSIPPQPCTDLADVNDDGAVEITDAVELLTYLFVAGSSSPAAPFPSCGLDLTADGLTCPGTVCP